MYPGSATCVFVQVKVKRVYCVLCLGSCVRFASFARIASGLSAEYKQNVTKK